MTVTSRGNTLGAHRFGQHRQLYASLPSRPRFFIFLRHTLPRSLSLSVSVSQMDWKRYNVSRQAIEPTEAIVSVDERNPSQNWFPAAFSPSNRALPLFWSVSDHAASMESVSASHGGDVLDVFVASKFFAPLPVFSAAKQCIYRFSPFYRPPPGLCTVKCVSASHGGDGDAAFATSKFSASICCFLADQQCIYRSLVSPS